MQYGSRAARVASRGGQGKGTIVTAYAMYCFDARGVLGCGSFVRGRKRKKVDSRPFILTSRSHEEITW